MRMFLILLLPCFLFAGPVSFDKYFVDATMRVDYHHTGHAKQEWASLDQVYRGGLWAGSKKNLQDMIDSGRYSAKVYDAATDTLIFSRGFDSYFGEYQTTNDAINKKWKTYHESVLIPYPKQKIRFVLERRQKDNKTMKLIFETTIDPESVSIIKNDPSLEVKIYKVKENGPPATQVDITFIAVGYTADQQQKFVSDLRKSAQVLLDQDPYNKFSQNFNIYGVFKASEQSGCDQPTRGIYRNTNIDVTFNSLGSMRYIMTEDNKTMRDVAGHVPYDTLFLMVNHERYGGGGIYNLYCTFPVDNQWRDYLIIHEFGHSFGGLADEYYSSSTAYSDFYPVGIEPLEPNVTALLDPKKVKWHKHATPGIALPTPWQKKKYDSFGKIYQKKRGELNEALARLQREKASPEEIAKHKELYSQLSRDYKKQVEDFMAKSKFVGKVGVFQGAGYASEGLYRPMLDCIMFSRNSKPFCHVCRDHIIKVIKNYTE